MPKPPAMAVEQPRMMKGKGAPKPTLFGVLGRTKMDPYTKSLGGLVHNAATAGVGAGTLHKAREFHTERGITGRVARTHIPGAHYAQVPYAGTYMAHTGKEMA